jgi:hypothetical protein
MRHNLNSIIVRAIEAELADRQRFLGDRWHYHPFYKQIEEEDSLCPICSNAP